MKTTQVLFILSLILIQISIITLENQKQALEGTIEDITYKDTSIRISLEGDNNTYIIFTENLLNLKKKDTIKMYIKESEFRGEKQFIINKLYLTNR